MNIYFLFLELSIYIFSGYLFVKKRELAILYLPAIKFADTVIPNPVVPSILFYAVLALLLYRSVKENLSFLGNNIFSVLLISYFIVLTTRSNETSVIRENFINVLFFFMSLPLIVSIYKKYSRAEIFEELSRCAFYLLSIFVSNVTLSTLFNFNPLAMYGISHGILYGNMIYTDFNILATAIFLLCYSAMEKKNFVYLVVFLVSLCYVAVSLRRTVMGISLMGCFFTVLIFMKENAKTVIVFGFFAVIIGGVIAIKADLLNTFNERYELRKLDDRDIEEEKRYIEYDLLYEDMFRYKRYSPWIGFGLFNSPGNYGGGVFYERSLHGDLTSIMHSSGFIGLGLYLLMVITAFIQCFKAVESRGDKLIVLFCAIDFITFTGSGRYTEYGSMLILFLTAYLPLAKVREPDPDPELTAVEYIDESYPAPANSVVL